MIQLSIILTYEESQVFDSNKFQLLNLVIYRLFTRKSVTLWLKMFLKKKGMKCLERIYCHELHIKSIKLSNSTKYWNFSCDIIQTSSLFHAQLCTHIYAAAVARIEQSNILMWCCVLVVKHTRVEWSKTEKESVFDSVTLSAICLHWVACSDMSRLRTRWNSKRKKEKERKRNK